MADKAWVQFLLVAAPVLSLVGAWLALRGAGARSVRPRPGGREQTASAAQARGEHDEAMDR